MGRLLRVLLLLTFLLPFTYGGCNGGGGGSDYTGTAPAITDIQFYRDAGGGVMVNTNVFTIGDSVSADIFASDPDLDMSTMVFQDFFEPDFVNPMTETPSTLPSQIATDMIYFPLQPVAVGGPAGNWRMCVYVVDALGHESNTFCVNYIINP